MKVPEKILPQRRKGRKEKIFSELGVLGALAGVNLRFEQVP
jgi:hypothetical protein